MKHQKVIFTRYSFNGNVRTPKTVFEELQKEFDFTFDPCPLNPDPTIDGLKINWHGRVYVNPPYSYVRPWLEKAISELQNRNCELVVFLLKSATGTKWFHEIIIPFAKEIRAIKGRLSFTDDGDPAPFDSLIVVFKPEILRV